MALFINFLVSLIKKTSTPPILENGMFDIITYFSVDCSFSSVMLPPLGFVYVRPVADIETYAYGSTVLRAKCKLYPSGQLAGKSIQAKGGCVLLDSGVFVQPFFKGAEDFPAPGPSEKQHQHSSYRMRTKNMIHSAVFEMLTKENKLANGFVFIYFLWRL